MRYAEQKGHGEVEILAGPEECSVEGAVYWVRNGDGNTYEVRASTLTFPPHKEYWRNEYSDGNSGLHQSLSSARDGATNSLGDLAPILRHTTHHWQQDENGPWQVEVIEL